MADTIARQFGRWAANLKYEDLPPVVVDKIKSLILVHLTSAVIGAQMPRAKEAIELVLKEEGKADGATIIYDGRKATRIGATFADAELIHVTGLMDSFQMITHPGVSLISSAMVNAELEGLNGKQLITALAAGYELATRLGWDHVPATAARGYRPAPIYHTMGAAMVAAKCMGLDEDGMVATIAIAANCASGLFEAGHSGGGEQAVHDPNAARQGVFAAVMARTGHIKGSELIIEGPAGFYNAYTGSHEGKLSRKFEGPDQIDLMKTVADLGKDWCLLNIMYRMYATGGYNHQVINCIVELREKHKINPDDIEHVEVLMNYLETLYPSPMFARDPLNKPGVSSTHYFAAHAAVNGGYPQVGGRTYSPSEDPTKDAKVLEFLKTKVQVIGMYDKPMFSPTVTIHMKDGRAFEQFYPYARMLWNLDQLVERLQDLKAKWPLGGDGLEALIQQCRKAEEIPSIATLHALTSPKR